MCKFWKNWFGKKLTVPAAVPEVESPEVMALKKEQYKAFKKSIDDKRRAEFEKRKESAAEYNNTCPKCGEKQVIDRVSRIQGSIDGSISGGMGGSLFGFGGSIGGHIHGDIDTNEISVCTKCGNQWKKTSAHYESSYDTLQMEGWKLGLAIRGIEELPKVKYDPTDLASPYNSLEEAVAAKTEEVDKEKAQVIEFWGNLCIEVIQKIVQENPAYFSHNKETIDGAKLKEYFGFKYAYEFLPKPQ